MAEKFNNVVNVEDIIRRIRSAKDLKTNVAVAEFLGVSKATISNWIARNSIDFALIISKLVGYDLNWLLTGRGSSKHPRLFCDDENAQGEVQMLHSPKSSEGKADRSITLYDITAAANLKTLFTNKNQYALGKIVIPNIPSCDGALYISGDSMYPLLKSGDIVGYKEVSSFTNLLYGEMYIVSFSIEGDEYLTVKYVNRSEKEGFIRLVSYNPHHEPMDIPMTDINALAIVKFSIRRNMMM